MVDLPPEHASFKPAGIPSHLLKKEIMSFDEYEAIRLADFETLEHQQGADIMGISRPTFSRLLERARHKLARFLTTGILLEIEGGKVHFKNNLYRCKKCNHTFHFSLDEEKIACTQCGSTDLIDYLEQHGHGDCCRRKLRSLEEEE
jgi:predicted DNA-binding protein (UPF0251 family)